MNELAVASQRYYVITVPHTFTVATAAERSQQGLPPIAFHRSRAARLHGQVLHAQRRHAYDVVRGRRNFEPGLFHRAEDVATDRVLRRADAVLAHHEADRQLDP